MVGAALDTEVVVDSGDGENDVDWPLTVLVAWPLGGGVLNGLVAWPLGGGVLNGLVAWPLGVVDWPSGEVLHSGVVVVLPDGGVVCILVATM